MAQQGIKFKQTQLYTYNLLERFHLRVSVSSLPSSQVFPTSFLKHYIQNPSYGPCVMLCQVSIQSGHLPSPKAAFLVPASGPWVSISLTLYREHCFSVLNFRALGNFHSSFMKRADRVQVRKGGQRSALTSCLERGKGQTGSCDIRPHGSFRIILVPTADLAVLGRPLSTEICPDYNPISSSKMEGGNYLSALGSVKGSRV